MTKEEKMKEVWEYMEEKGLNLGEKMRIRNDIAEIYQDEYPHISAGYFDDEIVAYHSEIKPISHYEFKTKEEVILANAIYENTKNDFEINKFRDDFIYTFKLLGIKSEWV